MGMYPLKKPFIWTRVKCLTSGKLTWYCAKLYHDIPVSKPANTIMKYEKIVIYSLSQIPHLTILWKGDAEQSWKFKKKMHWKAKSSIIFSFWNTYTFNTTTIANNVKKTELQLKLGGRLSALRDPQREGDKRKTEEDWYQIIQVFTSAYKTSTGASQCCALRNLIWEYICRRKKL